MTRPGSVKEIRIAYDVPVPDERVARDRPRGLV